MDGQIWLSSTELANALGYKSVDSVTKIFNRNSDEFTEKMTQVIDIPNVVNLTTSNLVSKTRIFSLRGCHLIAMLARTAVAKIFRKWVLDILDKEVGQPTITEPKITLEQQQSIKNAVLRKAERDKRTYQSIYREFYNVFDVPRYQELPLSRFDEALKWLGGIFQKGNNLKALLPDYIASLNFDLRRNAEYRVRTFGDGRIKRASIGYCDIDEKSYTNTWALEMV